MFVRAVVAERDDKKRPWMVCCGGYQSVIMDETLLHCDERAHFPDIEKRDLEAIYRFLSINYLAIVTLGSTGWSGWSDENERYFECTEEDLTSEGRALLGNLRALYGDRGEVILQTWLDT